MALHSEDIEVVVLPRRGAKIASLRDRSSGREWLEQLEAAGIPVIDDLGIDTYADARFFSYRRSVHRREPDYGRHVHAIALELVARHVQLVADHVVDAEQQVGHRDVLLDGVRSAVQAVLAIA